MSFDDNAICVDLLKHIAVFVPWGEEMPCGGIKAESFDVCKFFFNTCTHINPHFSEGAEAQ